MSSTEGGRVPATLADLLAIPEDERHHEIIDGVLARKAPPSGGHGAAQAEVAARIKGSFGGRARGARPGGWWIVTSVEIELAPSHVYRPDVVGWRRDRVPERPTGTPIRFLPDWICEVLSPSNPGTDRVKKLNHYHQFRVPHCWIVDPMDESLSLFRWMADGYLLVLAAGRDARVHAEPFEAIELPVGVLFGDEEDESRLVSSSVELALLGVRRLHHALGQHARHVLVQQG